MKQYSVYLAGPMKGLKPEQSDEWRTQFKMFLHEDICTYSPTRGKLKAFAGKSNEVIQDHYEGSYLSDPVGINVRDMNDVRRCDLVVAFLNVERAALGTIMEIAWARAFNKPVVIILDKSEYGHTENNHSMVQYNAIVVPDPLTATRVVEDLLLNDKQLQQ